MLKPPDFVRRCFLSWDRPLLPQAVDFLARDWTGEGPLDLSKSLVVVPTTHSGRRLREALAAHAAERGAAVFPPRVMLPESLVTPPESVAVAKPLEALFAWVEVLQSISIEQFGAVFPVEPPERSATWALRLGQDFIRLQRALAESGLCTADVVARIGQDFPEAERWAQIAELERRHAALLSSAGIRSATAARIEFADAPLRPAGIERVVVIGVPDPQPIGLRALAAHGREVPVDIVVFAPEAEAAAFDDWGRPREEVWAARVFVFPEFERRVELSADPSTQARRLVEIAAGYAEPDRYLGIGVADTEVLPLLENQFGQSAVKAFNPEGRGRRGDALHSLAGALAALARDDAFATVASLARCPDFLAYLRARTGRDFSAARFLAELDKLHARHLPRTLREARRQVERLQQERASFPELARALPIVGEMRELLKAPDFPKGAVKALGSIFQHRVFDLSRIEDAETAEAGEAWMQVLRDVAEAADKFGDLGSSERWETALRVYGESVRYEEKPVGAVELQGWLELLWEDAPHLAIAGLNDGRVPDAVVGDPFLPESLRMRLGLKTNAARFARDAYLLQALAACREREGRLDILFGKTSASGDPLRPSRLLLRCEDEDLPGRIAFLFRAVDAGRAIPAWRRAWRLEPRRTAPPERVAVTGLRSWLGCPFRFYLSRVLRMENVDTEKTEMDVLDFGTLCHAALEAMGREAALRDCVDPTVLREFLLAALEREATRRFGRELTLPLVVQIESARQRLSRVAEVQAQARADGWVTEAVERPFDIPVGGLVVTGKIDRIDRHEKSGAVRVLDYKTSDKGVDPFSAHLRGARREENAPDFARFTFDGREWVWTDLQLPLYRRAVAVMAGGAPIECAYFNLPKAVGETGISHWEAYPRELDEAAWRCAEGVAAAIAAGSFWPPNENVRADRDEFASLFHRGAADSLAWSERCGCEGETGDRSGRKTPPTA